MPAPTIGMEGRAPSGDGDINRYVSAEAQAQRWFNPERKVIFVNGMANSPTDHMQSARALSLLQACPVIGVYNKTDGFWADLGQCLLDKGVLVNVQAGNFTAWSLAVDAAYAAARLIDGSLNKVAFVESLITSNRATVQLYRLLTSMGQGERSRTPIYSHSQGNLITSNALTAVALALGRGAISQLEVNCFGSPCTFWPPGLSRTNHAFTFDPVSWLDLNIGFDSVKIGFVAGHAFTLYMQHDAEFVVNRFRWGSFGMTVNMDEDGLANYLVRIGNNPPRIKAIFQRLITAHWMDSDDVAHLYCTKMRTRHESVMRAIKRADSTVIDLIWRCLDEGITTSGEYQEMAWLRGL